MVVSVGVGVKCVVEGGEGRDSMGAGVVVVEGREEGVGGRMEYCLVLWRGPSVVALAGMGSANVAAT